MIAWALFLTAAAAFGQTFEVATVKLSPPGTLMELARAGRFHENIDAARVDIGGFTLKDLISLAYRVDQDRITGPDWIAVQRFDVVAKLPAGSRKDEAPEMMQALLTERFELALRHEEKIIPVYALVVGKSGPKFQEAVDDSKDPACNGGRGGHHVCHKMTMEGLAGMLTALANPVTQGWSGIDRPVVDLTGLKGKYDFTMDYGANGGRRGGSIGDGGAPTDAPATISAVEAVQKLGLRLEPQRRPFDHIFVEHAEKVPAEN